MRQLTLVLAILSVAACASINPLMQSATDEQLAAPTGSHGASASASFQPVAWAVGQWTVSRIIDKDGHPSVHRLSLVAQDADGFWLESETQSYFHHSVSKMLFSKQPRTPEEAVDALLKIVSKMDDKPVRTQDFTASAPGGMSFMKGMMKSAVEGMALPSDVATAPREDVTTPAGTFGGCAKISIQISVAMASQNVTAWFHPSVPLNGTVKSLGDSGFTTELLDYGMTGATSMF